jgi:Protein of unknown function (DUF3486)
VPRRSAVGALPPDVRAFVDQVLVGNQFGGYEALASALAEKGYAIGKSSLHRYGAKLEARMQAVKDSTEAARAIADLARDDADDRSAAVMSMVQSDIFGILVDLQDAEGDVAPADRLKLRARAAKSIAELSRASVNQKKWMVEVRVRAEAAATKAESLARKGGLTEQAAAEIRRAILGIAA